MNNLIRVEDAKLYLAKNYIGGKKSLGQCLDEVPTVEAVPMSAMEDIMWDIEQERDSVLRSNDNYTPNEVIDIIDRITRSIENHIGKEQK